LALLIRNPYDKSEYYIRGGETREISLPDYRFIVMADSRGKDDGINEDVFGNILGELVDIYPQMDYILKVKYKLYVNYLNLFD
jgi:hypothetical protein